MSPRLPLLLATGAACLVLSACGSGGDDPPETQAAAPAQTETAPAETVPAVTEPAEAPQPGDAPERDAPTPRSPLESYAAGGKPASEDDAFGVRSTMIRFQEALSRADRDAVCALTVGIPEKGGSMSCASLTRSPSPNPTDENRQLIAKSTVIVKGDRATAELQPGLLMPLRKVDGDWRLDYKAINSAGDGSRSGGR